MEVMSQDDNDNAEANANDGSAQVTQEPANVNLPPPRPQSREVKQDVIGTDERNFFEKETKSKNKAR